MGGIFGVFCRENGSKMKLYHFTFSNYIFFAIMRPYSAKKERSSSAPARKRQTRADVAKKKSHLLLLRVLASPARDLFHDMMLQKQHQMLSLQQIRPRCYMKHECSLQLPGLSLCMNTLNE